MRWGVAASVDPEQRPGVLAPVNRGAAICRWCGRPMRDPDQSGPQAAAAPAPGPGPAPPKRDPGRLADAMATAMKACAVWPRSNPRVGESCERLVRLLHGWVHHPDWLPLRVRGSDLLVGERR